MLDENINELIEKYKLSKKEHIEGSTITPDETASIYDTGTILTSADKVIVLKDATETKNHFTLFKYMLDTIDDKLSEDMIKKLTIFLKL